MGLFDSLIKKLNGEVEIIGESSDYELPVKYMDFPKYPGKMKNKPEEKSTEKYDRLTIYFKGRVNNEFIETIKEMGFILANTISYGIDYDRYDRDNTYIIIEQINMKTTKIVYHIKKQFM